MTHAFTFLAGTADHVSEGIARLYDKGNLTRGCTPLCLMTTVHTQRRSAVAGQPEVCGQLQLLGRPMTQLLSSVSMALAPAPACPSTVPVQDLGAQRLTC